MNHLKYHEKILAKDVKLILSASYPRTQFVHNLAGIFFFIQKLSQNFLVIKSRYNEKFSTRFFEREIVMTPKLYYIFKIKTSLN